MHKSDCAKHGDDEHDATPWKRCDCGAEPSKDWYRRRCAWYVSEIDRMKASHATQQAAIRKIIEELREKCRHPDDSDAQSVWSWRLDEWADDLARLLGAEPGR